MFVKRLLIIFFLPAYSFSYWQAWAYMGVMFIPMFLALIYFAKVSPELPGRRLIPGVW